MTGAQFMCIIGTIYLVPGMGERYRQWAGLACMAIAVFLNFFGK